MSFQLVKLKEFNYFINQLFEEKDIYYSQNGGVKLNNLTKIENFLKREIDLVKKEENQKGVTESKIIRKRKTTGVRVHKGEDFTSAID